MGKSNAKSVVNIIGTRKTNKMRLWSISPTYLDKQGLCGLWRETLLGQACLLKGEYTKCPKCLGSGYWSTSGECKEEEKCPKCKQTGKIKTPYYNHSQLQRFKECERPLDAIGRYLLEIYAEAEVRGYKFDSSKIRGKLTPIKLTVTKGQLEYEFKHLCRKVMKRDRDWFIKIKGQEFRDNYTIKANPIFKVVYGDIESWERIKK